jgi:hypothetical protein
MIQNINCNGLVILDGVPLNTNGAVRCGAVCHLKRKDFKNLAFYFLIKNS